MLFSGSGAHDGSGVEGSVGTIRLGLPYHALDKYWPITIFWRGRFGGTSPYFHAGESALCFPLNGRTFPLETEARFAQLGKSAASEHLVQARTFQRPDCKSVVGPGTFLGLVTYRASHRAMH